MYKVVMGNVERIFTRDALSRFLGHIGGDIEKVTSMVDERGFCAVCVLSTGIYVTITEEVI